MAEGNQEAGKSLTKVENKSPKIVDPAIKEIKDNFLRANEQSGGRLLFAVNTTSGETLQFMRHAESSQDKDPRQTFFGFGDGGLVTMSGDVANQVILRLKQDEKIPIVDDTNVRILDQANPEQKKRLERNLKMNLLSSSAHMEAKSILHDEIMKSVGREQAARVQRLQALAEAFKR